MPYKLVEENGGYYVVNEQTGKRKNKTPISKERAVKYMRALYAVEGGDKMRGKEIHDQVMTAFKRNFDKNTGGGVDRDKLPASDFVDPERRRFPIVTASDIMDAVHSYGRAKPAIPFEEFKRRVIAIAKRKGFVSSLPKDWGVETKEYRNHNLTLRGSDKGIDGWSCTDCHVVFKNDDEILEHQKKYRPELFSEKGGEGSGNFGHEGRPGEIGGSAPAGGGGSSVTESLAKHGKITFENRGIESKFNNKRATIDHNINKLDSKLSSSKKNSSEVTEEDYTEIAETNHRLRNAIERLGGRGTKTYMPSFGTHSLADFYHNEYNAAKSNVAELHKLMNQLGRGKTVTSVELDEMNYVSQEIGDTIAYFSSGKELKEYSPSLMVYKDAAGQDRWVLFSSNAYQDRDKEIVSTAALEADVARADKEQNYGPLRWWHVGKPDPVAQLPGPGADLGACDFRALHGRMLVESGTFHNPKVAAAVKEIAPLLQVSLGFFHPRTEPDAAGVFHSIKTFERSILPAGRASNSLTAIPAVKILDGGDTVLKEKIMAFRALLKDDELVDSILAMAEAKEKEAQDQGVAFKGDEPAAEPVAEKDETQVEAVEVADVQAAAEPVEEVEEEYEPTIGDLSPDAFAGLLAEAMDKAMEPHRKELRDLQASMKLKDDSEAALREAVESQAQTIKSLKSQLEELTGQQPRATKQGYRDSQSEATVVKDDSRVKGKQPTVDPDFIKMFTP